MMAALGVFAAWWALALGVGFFWGLHWERRRQTNLDAAQRAAQAQRWRRESLSNGGRR